VSFKTPITIAKAINEISSSNYVLPAIQREFVWRARQIEKLFDSLLQDYPIGAFLFWEVKPEHLGEFQFYRFMDAYHERDKRHNDPVNLAGKQTDTIAVLDGQQRLTALNIGLRGTYAYKLPYYRWNSDHAFPKRRLYLNLMEPADDIELAYQFRMLRERDLRSMGNNSYWFPVGDILKFEAFETIIDYCLDNGLMSGGNKFPHHTLVNLWRAINDKPVISYFLEEEQDLDKVLNVFIRVNSGGTILSYSDMLLSIATAQWEKRDARQEIHGLVDDLNAIGDGFDFNKDFVLKASLVLSDIPAIEFKVNNFNHENMLKIEEHWGQIRRTLLLTTKLLASWGFNRQTLVSNNAVIPLAYHIYHKGAPNNFVESNQYKTDREMMVLWLRIALLKRTFSGQPDNVLRQLRVVMGASIDGFPLQEIYAALRGSSKSMDFAYADLEGLVGYQYGQNYTFSVLSMLYPWLKYDQHFHIDHIYPQRMFRQRELKKHGIPEEDWGFYQSNKNSLANLQLLQGLVNQAKLDKEFESWLAGECDTPQDLEAYRKNHLIPDIDLSFRNFRQFIEERERIIIDFLADLLGVNVVETVDTKLDALDSIGFDE
jgi:hypothetical protein